MVRRARRKRGMGLFGAAAALLIPLFALGCGARGRVAAPASPAAATPADSGSGVAALLQANPGRAILVRGTYAFKGLPHFPPNAVPGLAAEYRLAAPTGAPTSAGASGGSGGSELSLRVWYTREPLVFGEGWKRGSLGPYTSYELRPDSSPALFLAIVADKHELFLELPQDLPALRSFALELERKFGQFFLAAASDAELSFPAYVDLPR